MDPPPFNQSVGARPSTNPAAGRGGGNDGDGGGDDDGGGGNDDDDEEDEDDEGLPGLLTGTRTRRTT